MDSVDERETEPAALDARVCHTNPTPDAVREDVLEVGFVPDGRKEGQPRRRLVPGLRNESTEDSKAGLSHEFVSERIASLARREPQNVRFCTDLQMRTSLTASFAASVSATAPSRSIRANAGRYAGASSFVSPPTRTDISSR